MSTPFFVAETPRAGEWGHRFILPPDCSEGSSLAAEFCRNAAKYGAGKNFVGVTQPVVQQLSNGAVRQGVETLVLVGVDYARLDNDQKQHLMTVLARRLADLGTLVTQRIDWKREGQNLVVTRQEFGHWLREDGLRHFPSAPVSTGPVIERWRPRLSHVVAALMIIALAGSVGLYMFSKDSEKKHPTKLDLCIKQFRSEVYAAKTVQEDPNLTKLLEIDANKQMIEQSYCKDRYIDAVALLANTKERNKLKTFLKDERLTIKHAQEHRKQFAKLGKALANLHNKMKNNGWVLDEKSRMLPIINSIDVYFSRNNQMTSVIEDQQGRSPFFDEHDLRIFELLNILFLHSEAPVRKAFPEEDYKKLYETSLRAVLEAVSEYKDKIRSDIFTQKKAAKSALQNKTPAAENNLVNAYEALDDFFFVDIQYEWPKAPVPQSSQGNNHLPIEDKKSAYAGMATPFHTGLLLVDASGWSRGVQ